MFPIGLGSNIPTTLPQYKFKEVVVLFTVIVFVNAIPRFSVSEFKRGGIWYL